MPSLRKRLRQALHRLLPDRALERGAIVLNRRRIYILPTAQGWLLALVLLAILVGAINYANALAFALVFLLAGLALIALLHTWRNLLGLRIEVGRCSPVFAGELAQFSLHVENLDPEARRALEWGLVRQSAQATADIPPGRQTLSLRVASLRRGYLSPGSIALASRFPLGLFRAWAVLRPQVRCLVYPAPVPDQRPLPPGQPDAAGMGAQSAQGEDDFAALHPWRMGDSLHRVHWKSAAKDQGLYTKQFSGHSAGALWLDWDALGGLDKEARLAQLCRWVLDADATGQGFGLRLPGLQIDPGSGTRHRQRCLEALALYGEPDPF